MPAAWKYVTSLTFVAKVKSGKKYKVQVQSARSAGSGPVEQKAFTATGWPKRNPQHADRDKPDEQY